MQNTKAALKQDVKREILRELQNGNSSYGYTPNYTRPNGSWNYRTWPDYNDLNQVKQEVMFELGEELYGNNYGNPYSTVAPYNRTIVDSIKQELMAEIEAQRATKFAQAAGYGQVLADPNLNRMVDERYRTLDNIRGDLRRELQAIHSAQSRAPVTDPQTRAIAESIALEANQQGVPLKDVIQRIEAKPGNTTGVWGRMSSMLNVGQRKGFLWGIGASAVAFLLWPSARNNLHSVAVRSVEGGMSWADRARSFVSGNGNDAPYQSPDPADPNKPDIDILQ
ncbi:MAG: hypothetical protein M0Z55_11085 [Peptococcaceae bacterium]|nr:hypothetical protein [Peptococcaceae bacterium]